MPQIGWPLSNRSEAWSWRATYAHYTSGFVAASMQPGASVRSARATGPNQCLVKGMAS